MNGCWIKSLRFLQWSVFLIVLISVFLIFICPDRTQRVYSCKAYDWSVVTDPVLLLVAIYNHWSLHRGFRYTSWKSYVRYGQCFEHETFINDCWQFFNVGVYVRFCLRCYVLLLLWVKENDFLKLIIRKIHLIFDWLLICYSVSEMWFLGKEKFTLN